MTDCALNYASKYARKQGQNRTKDVAKSDETSQQGKVTRLWNQKVLTDRTVSQQ
jgi:hypothetical protein